MASDSEALQESVYPIWQTESVLRLFNYISEKKASNKPLILCGFDFKGSLSLSSSYWLCKMFKPINNNVSEKLLQTDTLLIKATSEWEKKGLILSQFSANQFNQFYASLLDTFVVNKAQIKKLNNFSDIQYQIISRSILNRQYLAEFLSIKDPDKYVLFRDSIMAENINWLVNDLFKNRKIILWGADIHVSKSGSQIYQKDSFKSAVELLSDQTKDEIFSVSLNEKKNASKIIKRQIKDSGIYFYYPTKPIFGFDGIFYFTQIENIKKK